MALEQEIAALTAKNLIKDPEFREMIRVEIKNAAGRQVRYVIEEMTRTEIRSYVSRIIASELGGRVTHIARQLSDNLLKTVVIKPPDEGAPK